MADTWYGNLTEVEGAALGSLAVIAPLLERMGVADIIDRHLPVDPQAEFTHGRLLGLLIAARVYSPVALSNVVEWAGQSGADILWQIAAEKLNDDRLGGRSTPSSSCGIRSSVRSRCTWPKSSTCR